MDAQALTPVDAALWAAALALFGTALWLSRPRPRGWRPDVVFTGLVAVLRSGGALETAPLFGAGCDADAARRWYADGTGPVAAALARRAATLLCWGPLPPGMPAAPGWDSLVVGDPADSDQRAALEASLERALSVPSRRFVVLVTSDALGFLRFYSDVPGLRDRVRAVCFVGLYLGPAADWLADSFTHQVFDLELDRSVPWLTLRTAPGQVLRTPPPDPTGRESIEVVDLGEAAAPVDPATGAALLLLLAALV